jgi:GTP-binding protein
MQKTAGTHRLFVDQVTIFVAGGKGGDGCVSFRRELYVPKGGPDGGDGGHGGSVWLHATSALNTLLDLTGRHHYRAESGVAGSGANCAGRRGKDLIVSVPAGTLVYDADAGRLLKDLVDDGQRVRVARGGRGGHGNAHFASSTNQAPRNAEPGMPGQERTLRLELRLIADVGLVGMPNAGKSTLLSRLTRARPKIAAYPFTTTEPHLGILELSDFRRLVLADIPGLIEGAHEGVGLGDAFLRHIERTRMIVHLIDLCPPEGAPSPAAAHRIIRRELEKYSPRLAERDELIVGSKLDLTGADDALAALRGELQQPVMGVSGVSGAGLRDLAETMWSHVQRVRDAERNQGPVRFDLDQTLEGPAAEDAGAGEVPAEAADLPGDGGEAAKGDAE